MLHFIKRLDVFRFSTVCPSTYIQLSSPSQNDIPRIYVARGLNRKASSLQNQAVLETLSTADPIENRNQLIYNNSSFPAYEKWKNDPSLLNCCESETSMSVAMLLSGGVDSSVALALLKAAGHKLTAFYLKIWFQEDFENFWTECPWEEDLRYAHEVCQRLEVPLKVLHLTDEYWEQVAKQTISEIKSGRTPNPDIWCNSRIKFGTFMDFLQKQEQNYDHIASGHYAKVLRDVDPSGEETISLSLCKDEHKDQTYFLAQLTSKQLKKCLFPLGNLKKPEVRKLAAAAALPTVNRKESQGICFLGKVKFSEFIERHLGKWPGLILEEQTKRRLGFHDGYWFYTIGQRTGLKLSGGPWYVTGKDIRWNVVYVSHAYSQETTENLHADVSDTFFCRDPNWLAEAPRFSELECKVRHSQHIYRCQVLDRLENGWWIQLYGKDQGLASGQYAVFYRNRICLGSGVIDSSALICGTPKKLSTLQAVESQQRPSAAAKAL